MCLLVCSAPEGSIKSPGAGVTNGCGAGNWTWVIYKKQVLQQMLLTTEPFLELLEHLLGNCYVLVQ